MMANPHTTRAHKRLRASAELRTAIAQRAAVELANRAATHPIPTDAELIERARREAQR